MLQMNHDIMNFHKTLTNDEKALKIINKSIKTTKRAMEIVGQVKHIEILQSLYNTLLSGKENYFVILPTLLTNKNQVIRWDTTEKGFNEFLELERNAKEKSKQEHEEYVKQQEIIKKAKEDGKKVEFAYENGKLKPIIVEEKTN